MSKLNHSQARAWIFSGQPLSAAEQDRLQAHLGVCDDCRAVAQQHTRLLQELPHAYPQPAQTRIKDQARLAAVQDAQRRHKMQQRISTPLRWAAGALVVVLAAALLSWALRSLPPVPVGPDSATVNPLITPTVVRDLSTPTLSVTQQSNAPYPSPISQPSVSPLPTVTSCVPFPNFTARYSVQAGDTLFSIARQNGTSVQELMNANCLASNVIRVGQILRLPAAASQQIQPITTGLQITLAGWSPDSRWLAFWLAEVSDDPAVLPYYPAELQFYDRQTGSLCSTPELVAPGNTPVYWTDDGRLAVSVEAGAFGGLPCDPVTPMTNEDYQIIAAQTAPDPRLSPGRRYRAETTQLADEQGVWQLQTSIYAAAENTLVYQFEWQRYAALGELGLGGEWLTEELLLITTDNIRGPLLVDLRDLPQGEPSRLVEVAQRLFGIPGTINPDPENYTGLVAYGAPHPTMEGEFHLLLAGTGIESQFPQVGLYHSEIGQFEILPFTHTLGFVPDGNWLLLDNHGTSRGYELTDYWSRTVDAGQDSFTHLGAGGYLHFAPDGEQYLHTRSGLPAERRSFPGNDLLNNWEISPYQPGAVVWSPDSQAAAVVGFTDTPEGQRSGLFLLRP